MSEQLVTFRGQPHQFEIAVNVQGADADWSTDLVPVVVHAYSLRDALHRAAQLPLRNFFPDEELERPAKELRVFDGHRRLEQ